VNEISKVEIERKFLVVSDDWRREAAESAPIQQAYVAVTERCNVRVRRYGQEAFITVKARSNGSISRREVEAAIAPEFVQAILDEGLFSWEPVLKTRYRVPVEGFVFEVDEFAGANAGLVIAEIELPEESAEFPRPSWLGEEVSSDYRYANTYLAQHPYSEW
jgi:adenylate cyclase